MTADENDVTTITLAKLLFETSLIESGFTPEDTKGFSQRVYELAKDAVGVSGPLDAVEDDIPDPEDETEAAEVEAEAVEDEAAKDEL